MPELPKKKIGIVACSGEEISEGTVARLAALRVLEQLRPAETVTICLPLFLAGGEGDRAFARYYPTITLDGCEKRCAYRATETLSNRPAGSFIVSEVMAETNLGRPHGMRTLDPAGLKAVEEIAARVAVTVDDLLGAAWDRRRGEIAPEGNPAAGEKPQETCACGSGIPVQHILVNGKDETIVALPVLLSNFQEQGQPPNESIAREILEAVKIYNPIPPADEAAWQKALLQAYISALQEKA
jgi:hypothetical protein